VTPGARLAVGFAEPEDEPPDDGAGVLEGAGLDWAEVLGDGLGALGDGLGALGDGLGEGFCAGAEEVEGVGAVD
jgi:hypothetical protein